MSDTPVDRRVTIPPEPLAVAELMAGDEVTIEAAGPDVTAISRKRCTVDVATGVFDGLYEADYLDWLRSHERA